VIVIQYKKDELNNRILEEAEKEFFEKGYEHASVRQIAKRAGTTISNLYNYYESKEALFEALVKDECEGFQYFIQHHDTMDKPDEAWESMDIRVWRRILEDFIHSLPPIFTKRFYILLNCSRGTRYEETKTFFIRFMNEHFLEHMDTMGLKGFRELGNVIAEQMLGGILSIIRDYADEKQVRHLIVEYILFFFMGYMGLMLSNTGQWPNPGAIPAK